LPVVLPAVPPFSTDQPCAVPVELIRMRLLLVSATTTTPLQPTATPCGKAKEPRPVCAAGLGYTAKVGLAPLAFAIVRMRLCPVSAM